MGYELDRDVVRWGLHDLEVCTLTNAGSSTSVTRYEPDAGTQGYVTEGYNQPVTAGYVDNDAVIAQFYQDELSRLAQAEASGINNPNRNSVVEQEWPHSHQVKDHQGEGVDIYQESDILHNHNSDMDDKNAAMWNQGGQSSPSHDDDSVCSVEIEEESWSEFGKRLNEMIPIAHVPKINGELPSEDEQVSDHERLFQRLQLYGLVENKIEGDGNCQFRSLSDQLYRSPEHHHFVREQVVNQLAYNREMYEGYVPMAFNDYLKTMKRNGEWGDHVTLQAAADWFGVRMFVITSFKDTCYIEILPHFQKSNRLICLSFWAEVHYNSIYPEGELPIPESKKKKKFWVF
ncbi:hypothetical protein CARUB_v10001336mg [Capsella rubella]|uniref:ubiquitinyl hydrolase 1 n=1 Tax=Capsella rubella TaxID=81985 RepID=R0FGE4_9BRAS|nr:uncharacterized protein LOC17881943 [Capsella rubella]EOA21001.1 hypothetical protein CARUB_v10001336mg [Capsella rubella]